MPKKTGLGAEAFFAKRPAPELEHPVGGQDKLRQTTIMLEDRHLDWLEAKMIEARKNGGKPIRKAALIRALIELAMSSPINLAGLRSETEVVDRLERAIKSK